MKRISIYILAFFTIVELYGQGRVMSLDECISAAIENNPELQAGRKKIDKMEILTGTAFDAPNTGIELSQDATGGGSMENGLKFSQEFEFPTLYAARRKALKADYSVAQGEYREAINRFIGDVTIAYYSVVYAKERLKLYKNQAEMYDEFTKIASERYKAGDASKLETINAERLKAKGLNDLREAKSEMESSLLELKTLLGTDETIIPADSILPVLNIPDLTDELYGVMTLRGKLRSLELKQSERYLGVAKQEFLPGFFIAATTQLLIKGFNPYDIDRPRFEKGNFMGFQVGVTVPVFFGAKRAKLLAAKRDVEIARLRIEQENSLISQEYAKAKNEFNAARQSLDYYEMTGINQANDIVNLAKISYELGDIDYMEYIQNMETASDIRQEYIGAINRYNQAIIKLRTLKGNI